MNTLAIESHQLLRRQGQFKLGPLDWTVPTGAIYALVGPNGAGKSTLIDLLMGMGRAEHGTIKVLGLDLEQDEVAIKRRVAYVSPELNYTAWRKVGRAIDFVAGFYSDWDAARCEYLLTAFDLDRDAKIASLSFGSRTKLSLVIALSRQAELLLLDEPSTGLDPMAREVMFTELLRIMQSPARTILISSHDLTGLERFADHVGILREGQMLLSGAMDEVIHRYCEVEVEIPRSVSITAPGVKSLHREGNRARLLVDRTKLRGIHPYGAGATAIAEAPMTLEQIFIGLMKSEQTIHAGGER